MTPTPEQIISKYKPMAEYPSYYHESQIEQILTEYATHFGYTKEDIADAWDAAINYVNNGGYDDAEIDAPNKEQYLASLRRVGDGWQPIETAPKDGTILDVCLTRELDGQMLRETDVKWFDNQWCSVYDTSVRAENVYWKASHWMLATPLPQPPITK